MENSELITKALNYIQAESAKNDITIDDIASHAGFSTDYFNRVFFAHTGFNIMEYVRFSRLKNAAQLLRLTSIAFLTLPWNAVMRRMKASQEHLKINTASPRANTEKETKKQNCITAIFIMIQSAHGFYMNSKALKLQIAMK